MSATPQVYDLVVAGAGPVGLAVAIHARLGGLRALVLERRPGPGADGDGAADGDDPRGGDDMAGSRLDKACGEGIMPAGVAALDAIGVHPAADRSHPFRGIRYLDGDLVAEGRFRGPPGLGIRRTHLAGAFLDRATELGVEIRFGTAVEEWDEDAEGVFVETAVGAERGRFLVGADGLHSVVRRRAGLERPPRTGDRPRRGARYGVRRHFAVRPWTDLVEVHLVDEAEAYVTPVGPELIGVAILFSPGRSPDGRAHEPDGCGGSAWDALFARFPTLAARLENAGPVDRARGAGPLRRRVRCRTGGRVALVGDAAGYVDALTGQGIELGLASAEALVRTIRTGAPLERYEDAYRRITRRYYIGANLLLGATRSPVTRRGLVRLLAAAPRLFDRAVAAL